MNGDSPVNHRIKEWRQSVGDTLREVREKVNATQPEGEGWALSTVNNYESRYNKSAPTAYVLALKKAYPSLNMDWLLFDDGEPTVGDQEHAERREALLEKLDADPDAWEEEGEVFQTSYANVRTVLQKHGVPMEVHGPLQHLIARAHRYDVARQRRQEFLDGLDYGEGGLSEAEIKKANRALRDYLPDEEVEIPKEYAREFLERRLDPDSARAAHGTHGEHVAAWLNQTATAFLAEFGSRTAADRQFKRQPEEE